MSHPAPEAAAKRSKKRKLKPAKPILEQLPAAPVEAPNQQQHKNSKRQHRRQQQEHQQQSPQQQSPQEGHEDALSAGNSKFARALGSTDFHTREQGLQALSRLLTHKQLIPEVDMLKLWKGIYFCFWHSDKEPVQEDLAVRLSGLIPKMQQPVAQLYWAAMLHTLRAEWFALDRHRLNKFLMLARKFVAAVFARLAAADWDAAAITAFTVDLPLIHDLVPTTQSSKSPLGLSYHLADVWLPELRTAAGEQALPADALQQLLVPFVSVLQHSGEAALVSRVRESVFEALVQDLTAAAAAAGGQGDSSSSSDDDDDVDDNEDDVPVWAYCQQLDVQQYAAVLFDSGAEAGVKARNREALYGISKDLERLAGTKRKGVAAAAAAAAAPSPQPNGRQQQQKQQSPKQQQQQDAKGKKAKKAQQQQHQAEEVEEVEVAVAPAVALNGPAGNNPKKRKQAVQEQQQELEQQPQQQQEQAVRAKGTPPGSSHKKQKKQPGSSSKKAAAQAADPAAAAAAGGSSSSAVKRGVRINLKHNLYFEHGAPPPAADVRTPPRAKPKGSALKGAAQLDSNGRPAPHTAPPGSGKQQQMRRRIVTPSSVPRLKASEFF